MSYIYPAELAVSEWFGKPVAATAKTQTEEELEVIAQEKEALTPPAISVAVYEADSWFNGRYDRLSKEGALDPKKKSVLLCGGRPQNDFKRGAHWFHESPFLPYGWGVESPKGASSLKQMAMRATVRDQSILTADLFHNVPYNLAEYLWYSLGECDKQTMHLWRIMAEKYPKDFYRISSYYCFTATVCKSPLIQYIDMIHSEKIHWRAILSVSTNIIEIPDLVAIGYMRNLVALEINKTGLMNPERGDWAVKGGMTDGVVKSWVEMSKNYNSLQHLRVIKFRNQDRLTPHALAYLWELPELQFVITQNCKEFTDAVRPLCDMRPVFGADTNKNPDPRIHNWIARNLENIAKVDRREEEILCPLINLYNDTPNQLWPSFKNMVPIRPLSLEKHVPVMEFQLPFVDRGVFSYYQQKHKPKAVCCFVRGKEIEPPAIKRGSEAVGSHGFRPQKRVMKEREDTLDLAKMMNGFY